MQPIPPFICKFCGLPSYIDPADQSPPPDYCHESDHGLPDEEDADGDLFEDIDLNSMGAQEDV